MARRVYTPEQRDEALRLYETDGLASAHRATNIPKTTIQSWAKKRGVRTSATQNVREANAAQSENFKARRGRIVARLYGLAESTLDLLENPAEYQTITRGAFGVEEAAKLGFIPAQDKQREATAIAIYVDKAGHLEKFDHDGGAAEAKGLLSALRDKMGMQSER